MEMRVHERRGFASTKRLRIQPEAAEIAETPIFVDHSAQTNHHSAGDDAQDARRRAQATASALSFFP
jgi:hypothetical protein